MDRKNNSSSHGQHHEAAGKRHVHHEQHLDHLKPGQFAKKGDTALVTHPLPSTQSGGASLNTERFHTGHDLAHIHHQGCGHQEVLHNGHFDFLVDDHLHHVQDGHCFDHGKYNEPTVK